MKLICIGSWFGAERPFSDMFEDVLILSNSDIPKWKFSKDQVVLFGGGSDIASSLYGQSASRYNGTQGTTDRDIYEEHAFVKAQAAGSKLLGICRGAQLLCALNGGTVVQHVVNHAGQDHPMVTKDGEVIEVSSAHHQMMNPTGTEHELIAVASDAIGSKILRSRCHLGENEVDIPMENEPEVVYFPKTSALAIQYHPEFMSMEDRGVEYARSLVKSYLLEAV